MTTTTSTTTALDTSTELPAEHRELLATLAKHRGFLRQTVQGLTDDQLAQRTTASELCLGGIIKHVAAVEAGWVDFMQRGPDAVAFGGTDAEIEEHMAQFRMLPGDTLDSVLAAYDAVARRTEEVVAGIADLDASHPLPEAPWFEPGARWSIRRTLLHILAETSQHAGHADILRESLDGARTMG